MGRKKSNNALNKENKKKSISISPNKVNGDCVLEKKKFVIPSALKSNPKKIKKVRLQLLNTNNIISVQKAESSTPAANKLISTDKKRKMSVALEKSHIIDKMVVNNSVDTNCNNLPRVSGRKRKENPKVALEKSDVIDKMVVNNSVGTNCNNLPSINGGKRKGTPNTDLMLNPKKKKGMLPNKDKDQSLQPEKIEKKGVIDQMKHLKIVRVTLESPTKAKMVKEDLHTTSSGSIKENRKVGKKNMLLISPKSKTAKNNKSKSPLPTNRKNIEETGFADKIKDNSILPTPKKAKNNKSVSPQTMKTKSIEKISIAGKIKDVEISPEPKNSTKDVEPNSAKHLKIVLVHMETPTKAKMIKDDLQKTSSSSIEENGKVGKKYILRLSPKSKKAKNIKSKSPPPMNRKSVEENDIADKKKENGILPALKAKNNTSKNPRSMKTKGIEKNGNAGKIKDVEVLPEPKNAKDLKNVLVNLETPTKSKTIKEDSQKTSSSSIEENGKKYISPKSKNSKTKNPPPMNGKIFEENVIAGPKNIESMEKNGIAVQINDAVNLETPVSNKECFTVDQCKDSINLQRTRLNDFRKMKKILKNKLKCIERKGVSGLVMVQHLTNMEKLENSIYAEKTKLESLQRHLRQMMLKYHPFQVCTTGPPEPVEDTSDKKKLVFGGESTIGVNGIAVQINDSEKLKRNEECFTVEQLKDYINFQKFRLNDMRRIKSLDSRKIKRKEKRGIPGLVMVQELLNLKKLKESISGEAKKLEYFQKRLDRMINKKPKPELVEDTLNTSIRKMLGNEKSEETIIDVNVRLGLLANISVWSELLVNLPKEDRVMIFGPPSLVVPFLTECEPLLPLRQVIKDLGLLIQKEQEKKEVEQLLALQTPAAILEDNVSLPPTDDSEAKADAAPVTMVELGETVDSEEDEEEETPQKKKGKGFKKVSNYDESDSSWEDSSSEDSVDVSEDEYTGKYYATKKINKEVKIIKKDLEISDIVNLENNEPIGDNASSSCLRSDNYFGKPVGKFLIDIGSGLAHEYFQTDMLREQKRRLREQEKLQKKCDLLKRSILILRENLNISAEANSDFKFKQKICKFCDFKSESLHVMAFHMNSPHHIEDDKFKCNYCEIEMDSSSVILEHMKAVHGIAGHVEAPLPYMPCPLCPFNLKVSISTHLNACLQRFDINRNLVPEFWDLPAKIMPKETFPCTDKFVNEIRTFLSKSSVEQGSADCAGQTAVKYLNATLGDGESITNPSPDLATPACHIKGFSRKEKKKVDFVEELLKIGEIQLS